MRFWNSYVPTISTNNSHTGQLWTTETLSTTGTRFHEILTSQLSTTGPCFHEILTETLKADYWLPCKACSLHPWTWLWSPPGVHWCQSHTAWWPPSCPAECSKASHLKRKPPSDNQCLLWLKTKSDTIMKMLHVHNCMQENQATKSSNLPVQQQSVIQEENSKCLSNINLFITKSV